VQTWRDSKHRKEIGYERLLGMSVVRFWRLASGGIGGSDNSLRVCSDLDTDSVGKGIRRC